ncbi:MAG: response regulator transcription factor [Patescibacteria group bacterium]
MRILVVEDERLIASSIKKGLEQERYAVDAAYDGIEGFDLAATEEYDVIILDRMLPGKDGIEFCKELRKEKKKTPILMLTARGEVRDRVTGLDAGADDYLPKPFSFEELLARVRALSRRNYSTMEQIIQVDDLTLDTKSYIVKRGDVEIKISSKEFALLEFLMRNAGEILSKDKIITHVWDYDADILPNTIEVYIKNLRTKIDNPFPDKKPLLQTVRGFGYRIG